MIITLTSLIKQRISVPELIIENKKNSLITITCMVSVISIIGLTFFQEGTLNFTKKYFGLVDNFLFLTYLVSSFSLCSLTFYMLNKIDSEGIPKNDNFITYKKIILYIMMMNLMLYVVCLVIVSFYEPIIKIEKIFMSILIVLKEINSIFFIFNFLLFTLSMKYDLFYVHLNLHIKPDIEYFIDSDMNFKSML